MRGLILTVLVAFPLMAQTESKNPLTSTVLSRFRTIRSYLTETAAMMPEQDYEFRLTPNQRTFKDWIAHTAISSYQFCAQIKGVVAPDTSGISKLGAKAELERALRESFEYCDGALADMTDSKALSMATVGERKVYPVQGMIGLLTSLNEHYGNLVGYLRTKGLVPPSSARSQKEVGIPERRAPQKKTEKR